MPGIASKERRVSLERFGTCFARASCQIPAGMTHCVAVRTCMCVCVVVCWECDATEGRAQERLSSAEDKK